MSDASKQARVKEAAKPSTVLDDTASTGARAYAEALLNLASKQGKTDAILDELDELQAQVLDHHPRLAEILHSPSLGMPEKDGILQRVLTGRADDLTVKFLRLLNRNGRLDLLGPIVRQARQLANHRLNRRAVTVRSAVALDETQRRELVAKLQGRLGSEPVVTYEVDPSLLGGLVVRLGDELHDASVRGQLNRLRRRLIQERTHEVRGALSGAVVHEG